MHILIVYGTTEGQTRKVATFLADHIRERGNEVTLLDSTEAPRSVDVDAYGAVIAAGSVHNGRHQASLFQFVRNHRNALQTKPTALVSVSLSMASDDLQDHVEAAACADRFITASEWTPTVTHLVAGALRYTQYDFFKGWILKMIAGAKGASTDTDKDHEFTDWSDLEVFADAFLKQVHEHGDLIAKPSAGPTLDDDKSGLINQSQQA